jgi:hypothetical protein
MSNVQRFVITEEGHWEPHPTGEAVSYDDYEKLEQELENLKLHILGLARML